jgi:hypothetical protein
MARTMPISTGQNSPGSCQHLDDVERGVVVVTDLRAYIAIGGSGTATDWLQPLDELACIPFTQRDIVDHKT